MNRRFGVLGGDRRQAELARLLREDGQEVLTWGLSEEMAEEADLEAALSAEVVLLPLPLCWEDGILNCQKSRVETRMIFRKIRPDQLLLAGQVRKAQRQEAAEAGVTLMDYFTREELTIANAVPTAEGAIQLAMEALPRTICGMEVLVLGYGRIGKLLAHRLGGLGAKVTVAARSSEALAWAKALGHRTLELRQLNGALGLFQLVFNTIPDEILGEQLLSQLDRRCLCMDVASVPGWDSSAAEALGLQTIWARGLPGKLSPVSAAEAIRDTAYHILEERSEER